MTYILTCGCESEYGGFPSEWDGETRECEPAIFYGCLCEKHFNEYEARHAQYAPRELSDDIGTIAYMAGFSDGKKERLKQLSDEEIIELAKRNDGVKHLYYMIQGCLGTAKFNDSVIDFARAILKKASEK